jgi:hypothetical protein
MHTKGKEAQGLVFFAEGISGALQTFKDAQALNDPKIMIQAEQIFLRQDIKFCDPLDSLTIKNLERSLNFLNDSLRSIETVQSPQDYRKAETTHRTENRHKRGNVPKDVVHEACNINSNRLDQNNRTPGLSMAEKALIKQRKDNLATTKEAYIEMQKKALGLSEPTKTKKKQ